MKKAVFMPKNSIAKNGLFIFSKQAVRKWSIYNPANNTQHHPIGSPNYISAIDGNEKFGHIYKLGTVQSTDKPFGLKHLKSLPVKQRKNTSK